MMKTILPLLFILTGCEVSVKEKISFGRCNNLKSTVVYNKTQNKYIADSITINERSTGGKKKARRCEPGFLRFDLTVPFSLDPLSSVLSFSF